MVRNDGKIVVVGGGIAGLCAGVYARKCGYQVEILEMNRSAGGLATSWHRGDYTFETCLHWLLGSKQNALLNSQWREVFDTGKLTFVDPEEYVRVETEQGETLSIYANVDRMEAELLRRAPQDAIEIRRFASAVRRFGKLPITELNEPWLRNCLSFARVLPDLPLLRRWSKLSIAECGKQFSHPLLRGFFGGPDSARFSALALMFSLAWMSERNAGYPIGGSQAVIRLIVENFINLGGRLHLEAKVEKILVERDAATGVQLTSGERINADWVISAADGHATVYDLLGGRYRNKTIDRIYDTLETFCSYLQVSLGVARDLSDRPGFVIRLLEAPLNVDPQTQLSQVSFRFFHYDPTFAPPGKTAVTCFLPTRNFEYWNRLQQEDPAKYQLEKDRIAQEVIAILERNVPGVRQAIEVIDVATPSTVIRYTGNWKGSMEGWLPTPDSGFKSLPNKLPNLRQFMMVGQWVQPGGGLPSGVMTARSAVRDICKHDGVPFIVNESSGEQGDLHRTAPVH